MQIVPQKVQCVPDCLKFSFFLLIYGIKDCRKVADTSSFLDLSIPPIAQVKKLWCSPYACVY